MVKSDLNFSIEGNNIRFGLLSVKGISDKSIQKIIDFKHCNLHVISYSDKINKIGCKALFGGDGADELFAGYETYRQYVKDTNINYSAYTKLIKPKFIKKLSLKTMAMENVIKSITKLNFSSFSEL